MQWLDAADLARGGSTRDTSVVIADLDDPLLATMVKLKPTNIDLIDESRPLAGPRQYFLKRRALLRTLVAMHLNVGPETVEIAHDGQGAPRVIAPSQGAYVSVSARGAHAALAVSRTPVGVDMELAGNPQEPLWNVLHPSERAGIETLWRETHDDTLFLKTWIAREAYLKVLGTGFDRDPATIAVAPRDPQTFDVADIASPGGTFRGCWKFTNVRGVSIHCARVNLPGAFARKLDARPSL